MISLLLPNENVLLRSDNDKVVVTDHRVIVLNSKSEIDFTQPLSDIEYVAIEERRQPLLAVLAVTTLFAAVYLFFVFNLFVLTLGLILSAFFFWLYNKVATRLLCLCLDKEKQLGYKFKTPKSSMNGIKNQIEVARFEMLNKALKGTKKDTKTVPIRTVV